MSFEDSTQSLTEKCVKRQAGEFMLSRAAVTEKEKNNIPTQVPTIANHSGDQNNLAKIRKGDNSLTVISKL